MNPTIHEHNGVKTYRYWEILEAMPEGWAVDKKTGSPLGGHVFVTNRKSPLNGQKRALLRVSPPTLKPFLASSQTKNLAENNDWRHGSCHLLSVENKNRPRGRLN